MSNQCGACFYYRVDPRNLKQGTCRFNPPTPMVVMSAGQPTGMGTFQTAQPISMGMFPPVQEGEWCGRWQRKSGEVT